jgi:hypothetical protein
MRIPGNKETVNYTPLPPPPTLNATNAFYFMNNRNGLYLNHGSKKPSARLGVLKVVVVKTVF